MTVTVRSVLWGDETHLPAWPGGSGDSRATRAMRAARDVLRLGTVRDPGPDEPDEQSGGHAA